MIYRVKQFIWAVTAKVSADEIDFVKKYLTNHEYTLFLKLKVYEQKHCIKVAQLLQCEYEGEEKKEMIRVGLLHDIGKIKYPIGPIRKSIMVLLDKFTKGKVAEYTSMNMVKCYYSHPEFGYEMLKGQGGYSGTFLSFIKDHHKELDDIKDENLKILKRCDNQA